MKSKRKEIIKEYAWLSYGIFIITGVVTVSFMVKAAWSPGTTPTQDNVATPINISATEQTKTGKFVANGGLGSTGGIVVGLDVEGRDLKASRDLYENGTALTSKYAALGHSHSISWSDIIGRPTVSTTHRNCVMTDPIEAGCPATGTENPNNSRWCPEGYYIVEIAEYDLHNCNCMDSDWECHWLRVQCCTFN